MTHDKLLANLNHSIANAKIDPIFMKGLRAVVKLHKPIFVEMGGGEYALCSDCSRRVDLPGYGIQYPCKTIQAIEKELK